MSTSSRPSFRLAVATAAVALAACASPSSSAPPDAVPSAPAASSPDAPTSRAPAATPRAGSVEVPPLHPSVDGYPETRVTLEPGEAQPTTIPVKVARTPQQRQHGLMEVPELPAGTGMLFLFEEPSSGGFYMLNTLVPLDIAFVSADGEVVAIFTMTPCPERPCEIYTPDESYRYALEVPAGWLAAHGVDEGDRITYGEVVPAE